MIYICYIKYERIAWIALLAVGNDELGVGNTELNVGNVRDTEVASFGGCRVGEMCMERQVDKGPSKLAPASGILLFQGAASIKIFGNNTCFCYIRILLINPLRMIYICYIKYKRKARMALLAVRDDELVVGNDELDVGDHRSRRSGNAE